MSMRDDTVILKDMLTHAREAVALLGDTSREDIWKRRVQQLALVQPIEIVGEASQSSHRGHAQGPC